MFQSVATGQNLSLPPVPVATGAAQHLLGWRTVTATPGHHRFSPSFSFSCSLPSLSSLSIHSLSSLSLSLLSLLPSPLVSVSFPLTLSLSSLLCRCRRPCRTPLRRKTRIQAGRGRERIVPVLVRSRSSSSSSRRRSRRRRKSRSRSRSRSRSSSTSRSITYHRSSR